MMNAEIADLLHQAHEELEQVQITYQDWKHRCQPGGFYEERGIDQATDTHWGRGFALIKQARLALDPSAG